MKGTLVTGEIAQSQFWVGESTRVLRIIGEEWICGFYFIKEDYIRILVFILKKIQIKIDFNFFYNIQFFI